jgi:chromate transport protein ChrA
MEHFAPLFVGAAVLVGGFIVVWLATEALSRIAAGWPLWAKAILCGALPTLIIIAVLTVWHMQVMGEVRAKGQHEFMSPLVILIYGFPIFFVNFVINCLVTVWLLKRK